MLLKSDSKNRIRYERIVLTEQSGDKRRIGEKLWRLFAALLMATGAVNVVNCFAPKGAGVWLYIASLLYIAGLVMTDAFKTALKTAAFVLPVAVGLFISPGGLYSGFLYFANQCITIINTRYGDFISLLSGGDADRAGVLRFEILLLAVLMWLIYAVVTAKNVLPSALICLALFAVIGFGGLTVSPLLCGALVLGWTVNWIGKAAGYGGVRRYVVFMVLLVSVLIMLVAVVGANLDEVNSGMTELRAGFFETLDEVRYGHDSLPKGDMTLAGEMGQGGGDALSVTFLDDAEELYLKGFVGGDFAGSAWEAPSDANYHGDNNGIIGWLYDKGLSVPFQYGIYSGLTVSGGLVPGDVITVKNDGAYSKYIYIPYQTKSVKFGNWSLGDDAQILSKGFFGEKNYTVSSVKKTDFRQAIIREDIDGERKGAADYISAEKVYRSFVDDCYLSVPEGSDERLKNTFFGTSDTESIENMSVSEATNRVRIVLSSLAEYSTQPSTYDGNTDFVTWMLDGSKKANSAYFATLAVLAYRSAGIPARYAEGYYLSSADAASMAGDGEKTFQLTDTDAHSWAEVYMDGIGWIPLETTPGFYLADYTVSQVIGQPESSVNIVDSDENEKLEGNTADSVEKAETPAPKQETVIRRAVRYVGIAVLFVLILFALYCAFCLQARVRRAARRRKLEKSTPEKKMRLLFTGIFLLLRVAGVACDESRPYEAADVIDERFPSIRREEYIRVVKLLQKTVFGGISPDSDAISSVMRFTERLYSEAYSNAGFFVRMKMKYFRAL